jgi:hypothetical protein
MFISVRQRADAPSSFLRVVRVGFLLLLTLSLLVSECAAQRDDGSAALEPGKPIVRELAGDQAHSYGIALKAGQYLHVVVEQRGIDVVVSLFAPDGKRLAEVDSPNGTQGPEPVSMIAETSGNYRLEVRSLEKTAVAGRYEAKIAELRAATENDKNRIAADELFRQAELLRIQRTAESLKGAIRNYEESLPFYRSANRDAATAALASASLLGGVYHAG